MLRLRRSAAAAMTIALAVTGLAALLQWVWAGWSVYTGPGPSLALRWLLTGAVGAALLLPAGAAMVGAAVGRRIADSGLRDQLRVTQRGARQLALRAVGWALLAPVLAVLLSASGWMLVSLWLRMEASGARDLPGLAAIAGAHALVLVLGAAFAVWGLVLAAAPAGKLGLLPRPVRESAVWAPVALAVLVTGPALVGPLLPHLTRPERLLNAVLLVNPVTAAGAILGMDLLRSPHIYDLTRAPEYWYTYPTAPATAAVYLIVTAVGACCLKRLLESE